MPNIDKHQPGSFCWIELATTDQPAAKKFYSGLFGWQVNDMPMGPTDVYTIFRLEGRDAAAVTRTTKAGGKVFAPAFDVMDAGRMAVIADPTGATFCVWQAGKNNGI